MTRNSGGQYLANTDGTEVEMVEQPTASDPRGDRLRDADGKAVNRSERALTKQESAALADRVAPRTAAAGGTASSPVAASASAPSVSGKSAPASKPAQKPDGKRA
ncbi:hypothetical protein [Pyruvatibacter sp.]|uniref:hypothetical protein n=1 Tax=Pyruvatibacter sp. TaxID=1981328 RepID=UPI0032F00330